MNIFPAIDLRDKKVVRLFKGDYDKMTVSEMSAAIDSIATYNVHYGNTSPADTTKLWLKTTDPSEVYIASNVNKSHVLTALNTTLPTGLFVMGTAVIGNKVYLLGGKDADGNKTTAIREYNVSTNTMITMTATLPDARTQFAVAAIGDYIYILGGYTTTGLRDIYEFDPEAKTFIKWSGSLPGTYYDMAYAAYGNKIYMFGGVLNGSLTNSIIEVDVDNGTITTLPSTLPTGVKWACAATIGDNIYIFGGNSSNAIQVFNPVTGGVKALDLTLPTTLYASAVEVIDNKAYLFGGNNTENTSWITEFDPHAGTAAHLTVTLPSARQRVGVGKVGGMIYVFGGSSDSGALNTVHRFGNIPSLSNGELYLDAEIKGVYAGNDGSVVPVEWVI